MGAGVKLVVALVIALNTAPPDSVTPGFAVALPDMDACKQAVSDQFNALDAYYPAMEARCVEAAVLWESPIPRRKP